jgi:hypothetical protein
VTEQYLASLERRFPSIPWRTPVKIHKAGGGPGYACRVCVAANGISGPEIPRLPNDPEPVREHLREAHGVG